MQHIETRIPQQVKSHTITDRSHSLCVPGDVEISERLRSGSAQNLGSIKRAVAAV